ncbi:hypothetical protein HDU97_002985 [Phlyctochytrium planicorne]|nr:hypothetical protein HDU97_002985 [Phlyctochytrium planicorne]
MIGTQHQHLALHVRDDDDDFGFVAPPIAQYIANILREYPEGGQILGELVQNAEDANATEVCFVLDVRNQVIADGKAPFPFLKNFAGPAFIAFNNAVFSESDFANFNKLSHSYKQQEIEKIGRYGLGFKSVFHWTDLPILLSADTIVVTDPQEKYIEIDGRMKGGVRRNFLKDNRHESWSDFLSLFDVLPGRTADWTVASSGTFFRLPIRLEAGSLMKDGFVTVDAVRESIKCFYSGFASTLLFLKHVERISCFELGDNGFRKSFEIGIKNIDQIRELRSSLSNDLQPFLDGRANGEVDCNFLATIEMSDEVDRSEASWHVIRRSSANLFQKFEELCTKHRFVPHVAMACNIASFDQALPRTGMLHCFLPIPDNSNLQFHVNGFFSLLSNRRSIKVPGKDLTGTSVKEPEWNAHLISAAVEMFAGMLAERIPRLPSSTDSKFVYDLLHFSCGGLDFVGSLDKMLFDALLLTRVPFLQTVHGSWIAPHSKIVLSSAVISGDIRSVLIKVSGPDLTVVEKVPSTLSELLISSGNGALLSPESVLKLLTGSAIAVLSRHEKIILLEYLLSDLSKGCYPFLKNLALLPVVDNTISQPLFPTQSQRRVIILSNDVDALKVLSPAVDSYLLDTAAFQNPASLEKLKTFSMISGSGLVECTVHTFHTIIEEHFRKKLQSGFMSISKLPLEWFEAFWSYVVDRPSCHGKFNGWHLLPVSHTDSLAPVGSGDLYHASSIDAGGLQLLHKLKFKFTENSIAKILLTSKLQRLVIEVDLISLVTKVCDTRRPQLSQISSRADKLTIRGLVHLLSERRRHERLPSYILKSIRRFPIYQLSPCGPLESIPSSVRSAVLNEDIPNDIPLNQKEFCFTENVNNLAEIAFLKKAVGMSIWSTEQYWCQFVISYIDSNAAVMPILNLELTVDHLFTFYEKCGKKREVTEVIANLKFIPIRTGPLQFSSPNRLYNLAETSLREIFGNESVFPIQRYTSAAWLSRLSEFGLRSSISRSVILELVNRIQTLGFPNPRMRALVRYIDDNFEDLKAASDAVSFSFFLRELMLSRIFSTTSTSVSLGLVSGTEGRPKSESYLAIHVPLIDDDIENAEFRSTFGWNKPAPISMLISCLGAYAELSFISVEAEHYILQIYSILNDHAKGPKSHSQLLDDWKPLNSIKWILSNGQLYSPFNMAIFCSYVGENDLAPYLAFLPKNYVEDFEQLFEIVQIQEKFSVERILRLLFDLSNLDDVTEADIEVGVKSVQFLSGLLNEKPRTLSDHEFAKCQVPIAGERQFAPIQLVVFADVTPMGSKSPLELYGSTHKILHRDISLATARALSIRMESLCMVGHDEEEEYGQSVLVCLKKRIEDYNDLSIFREFLQNADDACARKFHIILDCRLIRKLSSQKLIFPAVAPWFENPCIWIFNDSSFRAEDWKNILKIGSGEKCADLAKIGKFGYGFCSVFHLTDIPIIISDEIIFHLDPHKRHSPSAFSRINFVEKSLGIHYPDHFKFIPKAFGFDPTRSFKGTIFCIPLRSQESLASQSEICQTIISMAHVESLIDRFKDRCEENLLFLNHVENVEITKLEDFQKESVICQAEISGDISTHRRRVKELTSGGDFELKRPEQDIVGFTSFQASTFIRDASSQLEKKREWLICSGSVASPLFEARFKGDEGALLRHHKLVPYAAIAFPLNGKDEVFSGDIYAFLPLGKPSGLPFHINAPFAMFSDRKMALMDSSTLSEPQRKRLREFKVIIDTPAPHLSLAEVLPCVWNNWLIAEIAPRLYILALNQLSAALQLPPQRVMIHPQSFRHQIPWWSSNFVCGVLERSKSGAKFQVAKSESRETELLVMNSGTIAIKNPWKKALCGMQQFAPIAQRVFFMPSSLYQDYTILDSDVSFFKPEWMREVLQGINVAALMKQLLEKGFYNDFLTFILSDIDKSNIVELEGLEVFILRDGSVEALAESSEIRQRLYYYDTSELDYSDLQTIVGSKFPKLFLVANVNTLERLVEPLQKSTFNLTLLDSGAFLSLLKKSLPSHPSTPMLRAIWSCVNAFSIGASRLVDLCIVPTAEGAVTLKMPCVLAAERDQSLLMALHVPLLNTSEVPQFRRHPDADKIAASFSIQSIVKFLNLSEANVSGISALPSATKDRVRSLLTGLFIGKLQPAEMYVLRSLPVWPVIISGQSSYGDVHGAYIISMPFICGQDSYIVSEHSLWARLIGVTELGDIPYLRDHCLPSLPQPIISNLSTYISFLTSIVRHYFDSSFAHSNWLLDCNGVLRCGSELLSHSNYFFATVFAGEARFLHRQTRDVLSNVLSRLRIVMSPTINHFSEGVRKVDRMHADMLDRNDAGMMQDIRTRALELVNVWRRKGWKAPVALKFIPLHSTPSGTSEEFYQLYTLPNAGDFLGAAGTTFSFREHDEVFTVNRVCEEEVDLKSNYLNAEVQLQARISHLKEFCRQSSHIDHSSFAGFTNWMHTILDRLYSYLQSHRTNYSEVIRTQLQNHPVFYQDGVWRLASYFLFGREETEDQQRVQTRLQPYRQLLLLLGSRDIYELSSAKFDTGITQSKARHLLCAGLAAELDVESGLSDIEFRFDATCTVDTIPGLASSNVRLCAHKLVLSTGSEYFRTVFGAGFAESQAQVGRLVMVLSDVDVHAFCLFLHFVYTFFIPEFHPVAATVNQATPPSTGFISMVIAALPELDADNKCELALRILHLTDRYQHPDLKKKMESYLIFPPKHDHHPTVMLSGTPSDTRAPLRRKFSEVDKRIDDLKEALILLEKEGIEARQSLQRNLDESRRENLKMVGVVEHLQKQNEALAQENHGLEGTVLLLEYRVRLCERLEVRLPKMEAEIERLQGIEAKLGRLDELEAKMTRLSQLEAKLGSLDGLEAKLARLEDLEKKFSNVSTVEDHASRIQALETKVHHISGTVARKDEEIQLLKISNERLTKKVERAKHAHEKLQEFLAVESSNVVNGIKTNFQVVNQNCTQLALKVANMDVVLSNLEGDVLVLENDFPAIEAKADDALAKVASIKLELEAKDLATVEVKRKVQGLEGRMQRGEARVQGVEGRVRGIEGSVGGFGDASRAASAEINAMNHYLWHEKVRLDSQAAKVEDFSEVLKSMLSKLGLQWDGLAQMEDVCLDLETESRTLMTPYPTTPANASTSRSGSSSSMTESLLPQQPSTNHLPPFSESSATDRTQSPYIFSASPSSNEIKSPATTIPICSDDPDEIQSLLMKRPVQKEVKVKEHLSHFDGLRGLCAFAVYNHHLMYHVHRFTDEVYVNLLGKLAVAIFFVLSGRVLLISFAKRGDVVILTTAIVKRLFRLWLPVLFVVSIDRLIAAQGYYDASTDLLEDVGEKLEIAIGFRATDMETTLRSIVTDSFNTFAYPIEGIPMGPLWSLFYEFQGSITTYLLGLIVYTLPRPTSMRKFLIYGLSLLVFYSTTSFMFLFVYGAVLFDLSRSRAFVAFRDQRPKTNALCVVLMLLICYALQFETAAFRESVLKFGLDSIRIFSMDPHPADENLFAACLIVTCLEMSPLIQSILSGGLFTFLGKISFMLYLLHGLVLTWVYQALLGYLLESGWEFWWGVSAAYGIVTLLLMIVCWIGYRRVDMPSVRFSNWVGEVLIGSDNKKEQLQQMKGVDDEKEAIKFVGGNNKESTKDIWGDVKGF